MTPSPHPAWRSMLFVPAHVEKFVAAAHTRGADACILDLEDSVPPAQKANARTMLAAGVAQVRRSGGAALVRVNAEPEEQAADLDAAVIAGVSAIVLPKVDAAHQVLAAADAVGRLEHERGLSLGEIRLIALIEDVAALPRLDEIATASSRLMAMILGTEDFSASAGIAPVPEALVGPSQMVQFACRRAGLLPFGFPASIAEVADLDAFRGHMQLASRLGFVGAFCIHPKQVAVLNAAFAPSAAQVEEAQAVVAAFDAALAAGRGRPKSAVAWSIDPVVLRARELLARASLSPFQENP